MPPTAGAPEPTIVAPLSDPTDTRPIREKRPWFIAGELGWNGLAGLGANLGYHPIPYLGFDAGLGLSLAGWRVGGRMRANLLKSEWTPFLAAGVTYSAGSGGTEIELESKGEKAKFEVLGSPYVQLSGGVSYTGTEGFVFMATTGYSILTRDSNTRFKSGSEDAFNDVRGIYKGGLILSVAFGYAF